MPTTLLKKFVEFTNVSPFSGQVTAEELLAAFRAAGFNTNIALPSKDRGNGNRWTSCEFHVRGATAQEVDAIVTANPGVIGYVPPFAPPLFGLGASNITLAGWSLVTTAHANLGGPFQAAFDVAAVDNLEAFTHPMVSIAGLLNSADAFLFPGTNENPSVANGMSLQIANMHITNDLVIPAGNSIVMTLDGNAVPINFAAPFTIPKNQYSHLSGIGNVAWLWLDKTGKAYLNKSVTYTGTGPTDVAVVGPFSYPTSYTNGAL